MREFNYGNFPKELLSVDIMNLVAKIQSTGASNKIEGIYTSDDQLKNIVDGLAYQLIFTIR